MSLAEADALLGPSYSSCFEADDPVANRDSLEHLARWCQRYTPWVSSEPGDRPESVFLDITGGSHLWGGEANLAQAVIDELRRYGLFPRAAIADNVGASWAIAHYGDDSSGRNPNRPDGIHEYQSWSVVVSSEQTTSSLAMLPVSALRLPAQTVRTLRELGVERIEQVESLTRASVPARLGENLLVRLDQAMGRAPETLVPLDTPAELQAHWGLECPIEHATAVLDIVGRLLDPLIRHLPLGWGILHFNVRLKYETIDTQSIPVGLCAATAAASHLLALVRLALERTRLAGPVAGVGIHVTRTAPLEAFQPTLFDSDPLRPLQREVDRLIDRLSSRLGRRQVLLPRLLPDPRPERACEYVPALNTSTNRRQAGTAQTLCRPIRLFDPPKPIPVHVAQPSGIPALCRLEEHDEQICQAWGPERIETGWWRGRPIGRDYYRIELAGGSRLWIFRDLAARGWFLHGAFE